MAKLSQLGGGALLVVFAMLLPASTVAAEISACKYLVVTDFSSDPYGIAKELRRQASAKGFIVVSATEVSRADLFKTCVMAGSWSREAFGGNVAVRVVDAPSGAMIAEAAAEGTAWWSAGRTVRGVVAKIYGQLGYTGYNDDIYRQRIEREYPLRPTIAITEEQIRKSEPQSQVEGIWSDAQDEYRLGIVPAPGGSGADYVAIVLQSNMPLWHPGEIKAEIRSTASPEVFTCTYFLANKKPTGATLALDHNSVLRGSYTTPKGTTELLLLRVWPGITGQSERGASAKAATSGTGFLLNRSGLIATNWHVVANAKKINVAFPGWTDGTNAEVAIKDSVNDLAVLRITDPTKLATTCPELPFQLASSKGVSLGQRVSTIGYPLTSILGSNPKFTEGVVSSKTGLQDDPRSLQISAEVQPGSSGSPLFDSEGNIVGIVVATLDAGKLYQAASVLPQNVNWAIKTDYLLDLVGMLPDASPGARTTAFSPEKAARCVAIISVW